MPTIGFIGGGNMAASLIGGLINAGISASNITVAEPDEERRHSLAGQFGINTSADNNATLDCEIIVLAVKPQLLKQVCEQLDTSPDSQLLFISIAAGIRSTDINRWLKGGKAVVRCMPNTPALLQCGASGLYANDIVSDSQRQQAEKIMQAVGIVIWVDNEDQLDAVTAVSGSGPAYFFLLMEAMIDAAVKQGLAPEQARRLTLQTAAGAATLAWQADVNVDELRRRVTSPGGTTEQAISCFEGANFRQIVDDAMMACARRSKSMAEEFD